MKIHSLVNSIMDRKEKREYSNVFSFIVLMIVIMKQVCYMKILIDAGHGIDTPGKRSPNGVFKEWAWNKDVAEKIVETLQYKGYDVLLINPEEKDISLSERANRANKHGKDSIFVSIHCNASGNGKWMEARRWSIWTTKGQTKSDVLATYIFNEAEKKWGKDHVRKDMSDGDVDHEKNFTVIYKTICPAVLIENFFMDNKDDVNFLLSQTGKDVVKNIHINSIIRYANKYFV
jgi:N-acetylmuramoyl-L-alanine amidase